MTHSNRDWTVKHDTPSATNEESVNRINDAQRSYSGIALLTPHREFILSELQLAEKRGRDKLMGELQGFARGLRARPEGMPDIDPLTADTDDNNLLILELPPYLRRDDPRAKRILFEQITAKDIRLGDNILIEGVTSRILEPIESKSVAWIKFVIKRYDEDIQWTFRQHEVVMRRLS